MNKNVSVRRLSSAGDNGVMVDVEEIIIDGGVVAHVFAAENNGRVQFKAQALGGAFVAWHDDFSGAVDAVVAFVCAGDDLTIYLDVDVNTVEHAYIPLPFYNGTVMKYQGMIDNSNKACMMEKHPDMVLLSEFKGDRITTDKHELWTEF